MKKSDYKYISVWAKKIKAINLLGGKCSKCGNDNIFVLDFHHGNKDKEQRYNRLRASRWSKIEKEISKCDLLCGNCHTELHHPQPNDFKKKIIELSKFCRCSKCNYDKCLSALEFHHYGEEKTFNLSYVTRKHGFMVSLQAVVDEIAKCVLLCRNCHSIHQIKVDKFEQFREDIYCKLNTMKELPSPVPPESVMALYNQNVRCCDIAKQLNCSKSTVSAILKKCDIKVERRKLI